MSGSRPTVVTRVVGVLAAVVFGQAMAATAQGTPRMAALVEALKPALPFPAAGAGGDVPADGSAEPRWFVVWPAEPGDLRVIVRANPLNREVQAAAAQAMERIQEAVEAAERKAQADYDRALAEVRRTGQPTDVNGISLDDEGVEGERIDAELELLIALEPAIDTVDITSAEAPVTSAGTGAVSWILRVPSNTYRDPASPDPREHFRAAEARLYFGLVKPPVVDRPEPTRPRYVVTVPGAPGAFAVVLRGNESLLDTVLAAAEWTRLGTR